MNIIEILIGVAVSALIGLLLFYSISTRYRNKKLQNELLQLSIDKTAISNKFSQVISNKTVKDIEEKDGFIKFLSDSRESAFEYIETTQAGLVRYKTVMGPIVNTYKAAESKTDTMKQIIESYDELMKLLPED